MTKRGICLNAVWLKARCLIYISSHIRVLSLSSGTWSELWIILSDLTAAHVQNHLISFLRRTSLMTQRLIREAYIRNILLLKSEFLNCLTCRWNRIRYFVILRVGVLCKTSKEQQSTIFKIHSASLNLLVLY